MIGPFEIAAAVLAMMGLFGVGWVLLPAMRHKPEASNPTEGDAVERLNRLCALPIDPEDRPQPWIEQVPLLADAQRIPAPFRPAEALFAIVADDEAWIVPFEDVLVCPSAPGPAVLRGRTLGKAVHAVRLSDQVYLDLVAAGRELPRLLAACGANTVRLQRFRDADDLLAKTGLPEQNVTVIELGFEVAVGACEVFLDEGVLALRVVAIEDRYGAVVSWGDVVEDGVNDLDLRKELGVSGSMPTLQWTATELLELSALGLRLQKLGQPTVSMVRPAFADRRIAIAASDDPRGAQVVPAVLNWAGVVVRKAGRPQEALGFFDAALSICSSQDDRADILYNRGYARLHQASSGLRAEGVAGIAVFSFESPDAALLDAALRDFTQASGLHPMDPDAWSQIAVIHELCGDRKAAWDAWLQAATRAQDDTARRVLLANAERMA